MSKNLTMVVGLGNPEDRYARTLHNAGFWFADELARRFSGEFRYEKRFNAEVCKVSITGREVWLAKPQSYMNLSGKPVRAMLDFYRLDTGTTLVVHDEIDLPPGTVRFKSDGGHGGHNGLKDVIRHCGRDFMRLRVGVGHPGHKDAVTSYVLKKASSDVEAGMLRNIDEAADVMPILVEDGLEAAMKDLHTGN
ncbi:MAG: aminoacyl-tRNA hydrolase [Pseudomonadota bacterium]|nr:aminoacyl-tRNA hydrolase [Pseudomonadota bacterium]MED5462428.1 aminoacyl-tRNA hydrolase [Pseudomonadota bacterium]MEE3237210.1 aminoacyl-tRNA hydrolase [Pseudomonadota bacterium]